MAKKKEFNTLAEAKHYFNERASNICCYCGTLTPSKDMKVFTYGNVDISTFMCVDKEKCGEKMMDSLLGKNNDKSI